MNFETAEVTYEKPHRLSGILLHPTSCPSPYGIGDLGQDAYDFVDFLEKSGQHLWQILPLTPTGFGDSPYQSFSAFAGQPLLISPAHLKELGLLEEAELSDCPRGDGHHVDYGTIIPWKFKILASAFSRFLHTSDKMLLEEYDAFYNANQFWLDDYALFMACKAMHDGKDWLSWEEAYRRPTDSLKKELKKQLSNEIQYHYFVQFLFFKEWYALKKYANEKDIQIIGDIPIFVSLDSADAWANQHLFQLDSKGYPTSVAGVPPDYFSTTGQLWGNPLYNWEEMHKTGYKWWLKRIGKSKENFDMLRIDHFRAFDTYYAIPYGEETAVNGQWMEGPGIDFFKTLRRSLGNVPIIAEDLGLMTDGVRALVRDSGYPNMKVLQFAVDPADVGGANDYWPHNYNANCVVYTGTHDNVTTEGWRQSASPEDVHYACRYLRCLPEDLTEAMICACLASVSDMAIIPMADWLGLGEEAHLNSPGKLGGNWSWRAADGFDTAALAKRILAECAVYCRT